MRQWRRSEHEHTAGRQEPVKGKGKSDVTGRVELITPPPPPTRCRKHEEASGDTLGSKGEEWRCALFQQRRKHAAWDSSSSRSSSNPERGGPDTVPSIVTIMCWNAGEFESHTFDTSKPAVPRLAPFYPAPTPKVAEALLTTSNVAERRASELQTRPASDRGQGWFRFEYAAPNKVTAAHL